MLLKNENYFVKGVAASLIVIIVIAVVGLTVFFIAQKPQQTPRMQQTQWPSQQPQSQIQPQAELCPDGVCDEFEKSTGACPQDCGETSTGQAVQQQPAAQQTQQLITVKTVDSKYKTVSTKPTGWFTTGQDADIVLSGFGFNNAGSPLSFNHPGNLASDGERLIVADRNNNRVLFWEKLPTGNATPDLVLGQKDLISNYPGESLSQLNWPVGVAIAGGKVVVADTYNDRVLIWNSIPTENGRPADIELKEDIGWPWAVWTDGTKLVVTSTNRAKVLIWNSFPTSNKPADISISLPGKFGTPRAIGSDGKRLVISDHNSFGDKRGTFFWKTFPTKNDQQYDFFMDKYDILWGPTFMPDGKFIAVSNMIHVWSSFPENENDAPDSYIGAPYNEAPSGYNFGGAQSGDGSGIAEANGKLYISLYNGNKVVGYNSFPKKFDQNPDFAIGAPDIYTNTFRANYILGNAIPATDGKSLFVASEFDPQLYVWKNIPDESGAKPDFAYVLNFSPNDVVVYNNSLILAGGDTIALWETLPLAGEQPSVIYKGRVGSAELTSVDGIAADGKYFYASDAQTKKIYVWEGIPYQNNSPKFSISMPYVGRLSSDGKYLAVSVSLQMPKFYKISELTSANASEIPVRRFNLPQDAIVYKSKLFVADTVFNRVQIWNSVEDALAGKDPDAILGQNTNDTTSNKPSNAKNGLFWPGAVDFDGSYLWVGEFKFSNRVVRFSVQ